MHTDTDIKSVDLTKYNPINSEVYSNGMLIEKIDTRDLLSEKALKLAEYKNLCQELVLKQVPIYKQMNILSGRETNQSEIDKANTTVDSMRTEYQLKKAAILAVETLEDLDKIIWTKYE